VKDFDDVRVATSRIVWTPRTPRPAPGSTRRGQQSAVRAVLQPPPATDRTVSADDQGHDQHHCERDDVLRITNGKGQIGGTKKKSKAATLSREARIEGPGVEREATKTTPRR